MIALYPIKPVYIERILSGEKKFELRRRLPKGKLDFILIYSTSPVSKVVGYAKVKSIKDGPLTAMWNKYSVKFGVNKKEYFEYFEGCENAKAIEFECVYKFRRPFLVSDIASEMTVPQSFCYINEAAFNRVKKRVTDLV